MKCILREFGIDLFERILLKSDINQVSQVNKLLVKAQINRKVWLKLIKMKKCKLMKMSVTRMIKWMKIKTIKMPKRH